MNPPKCSRDSATQESSTPREVMRLIGQRLKTAAQTARELQNAQAEDQDR